MVLVDPDVLLQVLPSPDVSSRAPVRGTFLPFALPDLGEQEISVQDIVEQVGTSQSNISQHLAILRDKGVLRTRKDANRVFYRVGDTRTLKLLGMMRDVFCGFTK